MTSKFNKSIDALFFGLVSFLLGLFSLRVAFDPYFRKPFLFLTSIFWIISFALLKIHFSYEKEEKEKQ